MAKTPGLFGHMFEGFDSLHGQLFGHDEGEPDTPTEVQITLNEQHIESLRSGSNLRFKAKGQYVKVKFSK